MTDRMKELGFTQADVKTIGFDPFTAIGDKWALISAGTAADGNTMTISWGFSGIMWNKPVVTAAIRQSRYTKAFIDNSEFFTMSFYPDSAKKALAFCGSKSGRDFGTSGKAQAAGLTALNVDGTLAYEEAELIFVCRKLYETTLTPEGFHDKSIIAANYSDSDWHTLYTAEITAVYKK